MAFLPELFRRGGPSSCGEMDLRRWEGLPGLGPVGLGAESLQSPVTTNTARHSPPHHLLCSVHVKDAWYHPRTSWGRRVCREQLPGCTHLPRAPGAGKASVHAQGRGSSRPGREFQESDRPPPPPRTRQRPRVVDCISALDCECVTAEKSSE